MTMANDLEENKNKLRIFVALLAVFVLALFAFLKPD
jgi:hypothetical protein